MALARAPNLDPEDEDYCEPLYDEEEYTELRNLPPPLRVPLTAQTQFIKDANGWIHLIKEGKELHTPSLSTSSQAVVPPNTTLDDVITAYERRADQWKEYPSYAEATEFFQQTIARISTLKVDRCVCIGIGTFAGIHPYCTGDESFYQLASLETVLQILRQTHDITEIFVQDPVMNSLDAEFLRSRNFIVLEDPIAQNHLTATSMLYAPNCEWMAIEHALEIAYPALFVGPPLETYLEHITYGEADASKEAQEFIDQDVRQHKLKTFTRVYKTFCTARISKDIVMSPSGQKQRVYWKN